MLTIFELNVCLKCRKEYDSGEDNIGLQKGMCHRCNVKNLKTFCRVIFLDECVLCENEVDSREITNNVCRQCVIDNLKETECKTGPRSKCENEACKECYYKRFISHEKSKYWSKRNKIESKNVALNSNRKFWFTCGECGHDLKMSPSGINGGRWCAFCTNQKRCDNSDCKHCFNNSFASNEKAKYWNVTKNNILPRNIGLNSNKKYWFTCGECKHELEIALNTINGGHWCAFCANQKRCGNSDCEHCFNNSFASHEKAKYWNFTRNNTLPRDVAINSGKKYWFTCGECKHDFEKPLSATDDSWCAFCANLKRCENPACEHCFNNSFASHEKTKYWNFSKNDEIVPRNVALNSHRKYWYTCKECMHDLEVSLNKINSGRWCAFCANKKRCNNPECEHCFNNSFASHEKARHWNFIHNNNISPRNVALNSHKKYWFTCEECKSNFRMPLSDINRGNWCEFCKNTTEKLVVSYVKSNGVDIIQRFAPDWCKNPKTGRHFPFDSHIESKKIIIEVDGRQHFEYIKHWKTSPEENLDRDIYKMNQALENGYSVIRIHQPDVLYNYYDWKTDLMLTISSCEPGNVYYLSKNKDIYSKHQHKMLN